jgi:ABC-type branched-subunit amino acid transport system ATPase component
MSAALLEVLGLTRRFGGLVAVDDMSLALAPGEILGLLGPNGSGKSTVLNLISGALPPDRGSIRLRGHEIGNTAPASHRADGRGAHLPTRARAGLAELPLRTYWPASPLAAPRRGAMPQNNAPTNCWRASGLRGVPRRPRAS